MRDLMDHDQAEKDAAIRQKGWFRKTIISFRKLFQSQPLCNMSNSMIGRIVGVPTATIKSMRMNKAVSTDDIEKICSYLHCQPGDFMEAIDLQYKPAKDEKAPGQ